MPTFYDHISNATDRTFGVEFETYLPEGTTPDELARAVASRVGMPCHRQGYNHTDITFWKLVPDGSLSDYTRGWELVSPPLGGPGRYEHGLQLVRRAADALSDFGCTVAKRCGFHVHVGIGTKDADARLPFWKNVTKLYGSYEPVLDAMMPVSRRTANRWTRSVAGTSHAAIDACRTHDQLVRLVTHNVPRDEQRYHKVNLVSQRRHPTVEYRQHSGTLDATKSVNWVNICLLMTHVAMTVEPTTTLSAPAARNAARTGSDTWRIGEMMLSPGGVTRSEAIAAVGWPSVSLPLVASQCGLTYTTVRTGRNVRYFANATATVAPQINIEGFVNLIAANDNIRDYIRQRTIDLGGNIAWAA